MEVFDLYVSQIHPNGNLGAPENLGETINTSKDEKHPFISADKNYFTSHQMVITVMEDLMCLEAECIRLLLRYLKILEQAVNTEKDELGFYLLDRNLGFVASNSNSNNSLNISKIEMTPVVQFMKGKIFDSSSKKIINDATINLI